MMNNSLPILICYSRSGGTLMNRILGSLENVIVLSEVNPWGSFKPMLEQAQEWFSLINDEERRALEGESFAEQILELRKKAIKKGKTIIIRDWSVANFFEGIIPGKTPSLRLETIYSLKSDFAFKPLVLVRDPCAVWNSNVAQFDQYFHFEPNKFLLTYQKYLEAIENFPKIKLEEFTRYPDAYMRWICKYWDVPYNTHCLELFSAFTHCTGDNTLAQAVPIGTGLKVVNPQTFQGKMDSQTKETLISIYQKTSYELRFF